MKNTAYAFAAEHLTGAIESYASDLARHFLEFEQVDRATVNVREHAWNAIDVAGTPAPDAFVRGGEGTRVATVVATRGDLLVEAGVEDVVVMKTTRSAFSGFPRDRYTTLPETDDRLMATRVTAIWRYGAPDIDFDAAPAVRSTLMEVFADHDSPSVQTSIWIMARAMLERHAELDEVRMVLPNLHHWLVDLAPFGLANDRTVYVATTEPHGLIEATVRRAGTA
jgi:urate oxidase